MKASELKIVSCTEKIYEKEENQAHSKWFILTKSHLKNIKR